MSDVGSLGMGGADAASTLEALAMLMVRSTRVVVLTGLRLGDTDTDEDTGPRSGWATHASLEALITDPAGFWAFYYPNALRVISRVPGPGHAALARLQRAGFVSSLITQAVDRLHRRALPAGHDAEIVEVHGALTTLRCDRCGERYGLQEAGAFIAAAPDGIPRCSAPGCGFPLRPSGTLWGEPLVPEAVARAWDLAGQADCFIILDSELRTVPMSLLPSVPLTRGVPLAIIAPTPTQYDRYAEIVTRRSSIDVLTGLADMIAPGGPAS